MKNKGFMNRVIGIVTKGENDVLKWGWAIDWHVFWSYVSIWIMTVAILCVLLLLVYAYKYSTGIIENAIKSIDALNLAFSLMLSAFLEMEWSKNKTKFTRAIIRLELFFVIVGGALYVLYSASELSDKVNFLTKHSFIMNVCYIIVTFISALAGFVARSYQVKDREGDEKSE